MKHWRTNFILILIILFGAVIGTRLFFLQVIYYDFYSALAMGQQKIFSSTQGERGGIFFKNKEILATSIKGKYLYVSPKEIDKKQETAALLNDVLGLDQEWVLRKIEKNSSSFELLKTRLTTEQADALETLNLHGVYLREEIWREYPQKSLASQLVGFLGGEGAGQYGLEEYWNDVLKGEQGLMEGERGSGGYLFFSLLERNKTEKGADLILTVDYDIQYFAEKLLKEAQDNLDIEGGEIIVMNPHSGKILALANFPCFNPNKYSEEENFEIFLNGAVQKLFEPGSVFKVITMAAALNEEKITPQTLYVDPGIVKIGGRTIENYGQMIYPGKISMTEVLEKSINTGAVFAERQAGHNVFLEYIERFGLLEKTGIDLPWEISSLNEELKKGYEINFATASFGQGVEMTPIQLARAFCVVANGGKLIKPYVVEKIIENDKIIETRPEIISHDIISRRTASVLTAMLVSVVENGFAKGAKIPGYYVAGKTGTAQVPEKGTYSADKTWQSFIGWAPAFEPEFLILVKLDNPKTKTAEYSALPIFQKLAKHIIDSYQIPPDH